MPDDLDRKVEVLLLRLSALHGVVVAFSGGADSAYLLAAAVKALGHGPVVAATAVSASLPASELKGAAQLAASLGVRHLTPRTDEMARPGYVANGRDRCFHCKSELLDVLRPLADRLGLAHVATGTNADDARDPHRPGIRAARERGAVTPLLDAGLTKAEVREGSRRWGLPTADKPAAACLSSRVAYGLSITPVRLGRVERAEHDLRAAMLNAGLPVHDVRVRDHDRYARVEVDVDLADELGRRPDLLAVVAGWPEVIVDPTGFRSGSMNEALPLEKRADRSC